MNQVISVSLDDSKSTIRNFYRKYELNWRQIKLIREIDETPRYIGLSSYNGEPYARKALVIETDFKKFYIELTQNSFGIHTIQIPVDIARYKEGKIDIEERPVVSAQKVTFYSENDAFEFFIKKIEREAKATGIALADMDLKMLRFSVEDEDSSVGKNEEEFKEKIKTYRDLSEFEGKIVHLIKSAYDKEMSASYNQMTKETVKDNYRQAYDILKKKDNYINVMIDRALGKDLAKGLGRFL